MSTPQPEKSFRNKLLKDHLVHQESVHTLAEREGASHEAIYANMLCAATDHAKEHFNWLRAALLALAKRKLKDANDSREDENRWPAGQEWDDLVASSQSIFIREACEEAGIPRDKLVEVERILLYSEE
jgi:hypothetical protein